IPPAPRGVPQIEVAFDVDSNGILSVTDKDKATGKTQSIRIEGSTGISKEEVERMRKEAEIYAAEDKKKKDLIETKNTADNLIYTTEKTLRDAGEKVSEEIKKQVQEKVDALKKVKESDNIEELKTKMDDLSQTIQKVGSELYKAAQGNNPPEGQGGPDEKKGPEEGQFKEKK
ncbi:MAG: Hsp70 family protein, partial [Candidatus Pacebacteria bacterium]|nr:Hsp70 family protein [Candidatus Paceibacterota bacterium]